MPGPRCRYCGKDYVQACWDAREASSCGNLDPDTIKAARDLAKAIDAVEAIRGARARAATLKPKRRHKA